MARPLLTPSAFLTLAGLCPACLDETRTDGGTAVPEEVVAVATVPTGNGRTPGYDQAVMGQRAASRQSGVVIVAEARPRPARAAPAAPPPSPPAAPAAPLPLATNTAEGQ